MKKMYNFKNTKKMKKLVFGLIAFITLSANINAQDKEHISISKETLEKYKSISTNVSENLKKIKDTPEFKTNPENFEPEIKKTISPLVDISKQVMTESKINNETVPELNVNNLSDEQTIGIGSLIVGQDISITTSSSVTECLTYAFFGFELSNGFWGSFTTRKQLLKAIGKAASKYLGVIGTALIVYDFTDCMGWI